jgi:hypothetical protein
MTERTDEGNKLASPQPSSGEVDRPQDSDASTPVQKALKRDGESEEGKLPAKEDRSRIIFSQIETNLSACTSESVEQEIAEILLLFDDIKKQDEDLTGLVRVAVNALFSEQPKLNFAKRLRQGLEIRLRKTRPSYGPTYLAYGLAIFAYVAIPVFVSIYLYWKQSTFLGLPSATVFAVAISGACGSIVSILQRIQDFRGKIADRLVLMFQGFFKPIVGLLFALFVFFVIEGNLVPITHTASSELYFFIALAFVCGFSERFASDIASKTERVVGGTAEDQKK